MDKNRKEQRARIAKFRLPRQPLLGTAKIRMARAWNAGHEHIKVWQLGRMQRLNVRLDYLRFRICPLPFIRVIRLNLDSGYDTKLLIPMPERRARDFGLIGNKLDFPVRR